ncbi:MAG: potassium channel protein [Polyangiales bacterium]
MTEIAKRLRVASLLLLMTVLAGTVGIHAIGRGRWSWFESLFHVMITLTTVGFGELPGMDHSVLARGFTLALLVTGTGSVVYFASVTTALVVEGELRDLFQRNKMKKAIDRLERHVIVCGLGRSGDHAASELRATRTPFVVIDSDEERLRRAHALDPDLLYIVGDATEDGVLHSAGIDRAFGVVAALSDDKDNLYVTLTARSLNASLRIISKCVEATAEPKLMKAGADKVVSPNRIGGMRMASEMIRPNVTEFLDLMLRDPKHVLRIEEARVSASASCAGRTIGEAGLRRICDVLVVAIRSEDGDYRFNPGAEQVLKPGSTLIVLGERSEIAKLRVAVA